MVIIAGCGNTLNNFRAYYNTYYNAEKNFNAGIKKIQDQPLTIDPREPVRIHPAPLQAGNSDFQKAIDKGAKILRKFPGSRWADNAVLLIGKSNYYRQEFYPALQKFEELRDASRSPEMEQLAIIWKARTLLDLKLYSEGVTYLESELRLYPNEWSTQNKAEIQALAGEHHAMLENWEQSERFLSKAVSGIENKKLLGRTFFLYGQVLERLERYGEAYFAFSQVSENFPGFEFIYWSRFKQADVARQENNFDLAISIYEDLRKDDKNVDRRGELLFEIARTLEMKGETAVAEKRYKNLLYGKSQQRQDSRSLKADIYYRLGKMYSEQYNNYSVAAAYFDSSSTISDQTKRVDADQDAQTLSDAFGRYTSLHNTIQRADSLLKLGGLSKAQLDSALKRIRAQKRRELARQQESESQNVLANRNLTNTDEVSTSSSVHGFLNYRNDELVQRAKAEFRIIWGNRPLIDDWRRSEAVRQSSVSSNRSSETEENVKVAAQEGEIVAIEMNLEEIPRTPEEKENLRAEKANAQFELGNLLFLNLNSPDRARRYFYRVIKSEGDRELRPKAMYSLFELFHSANEQDSLQYWGERILQEFPDTRYGQRVRNRLSDRSPTETEPDSSQKLIQHFRQIVDSSQADKATRLRKLALANRSSDLAPHIYYHSIEAYIRQAKEYSYIADSVAAIPADTSLSEHSLSDVVSKRGEQQSFNGAYWDSVRFAVQEFDTTFSNTSLQKRVAKLRETLQQSKTSSQLPTCKELGVSLNVAPSMEQFLATITYPEKLNGVSVSGEVVYSFVVNEAGEVESYQLISQRTSLGIEEAFEKSFEQSLRFEPSETENLPPKIRCEISFPIQH